MAPFELGSRKSSLTTRSKKLCVMSYNFDTLFSSDELPADDPSLVLSDNFWLPVVLSSHTTMDVVKQTLTKNTNKHLIVYNRVR